MRRSRVAFALGVVVPLLLVGGCSGDDPEPRIAPPASTSPSDPVSSATPTAPVEPTMPAAAKKQTASGAKAFVRHFWDVANYSQLAGDTDPLELLVSDSCTACHAAIDYVHGVYRRGGTITGGEAAVSKLRTERLYAGSRVIFRVTFTVTNTRQRVDEPGTKNDKVFRAVSVTDRFVLDPAPTGWRLSIWEVLT